MPFCLLFSFMHSNFYHKSSSYLKFVASGWYYLQHLATILTPYVFVILTNESIESILFERYSVLSIETTLDVTYRCCHVHQSILVPLLLIDFIVEVQFCYFVYLNCIDHKLLPQVIHGGTLHCLIIAIKTACRAKYLTIVVRTRTTPGTVQLARLPRVVYFTGP